MTKVCTECGVEKPEEEFNWHRKARGQRYSECKTCWSLKNKARYEANKDYYKEKSRRNKLANRDRILFRLREYLASHPCVDCGETDPVVLDFDHVDPASKESEIGVLLRQNRTWERLLKEIDKCEVRCANCHRRRTATQQGWAKLGWA